MPLKRPQNWDGKVYFSQMVQICERHGDEVQVGYEGGESALRSAVLRENRAGYLRVDRVWKYRFSTNLGNAKPQHWLHGTRFLQLADELHLR